MNPDRLSFRPAQQKDITLVVSLVNSAYRGEFGKRGWTTESDLLDGQRTDEMELAELIAAEDSMILLGECGTEIVASLHLEKHEEGAYLGMLSVNPAMQGLGLGKRMMAAAEDIARREWGAGKMLMTVITLRHDVIAFYERYGYVRTGKLKSFPASIKYGVQKVPGLVLEFLEKPL